MQRIIALTIIISLIPLHVIADIEPRFEEVEDELIQKKGFEEDLKKEVEKYPAIKPLKTEKKKTSKKWIWILLGVAVVGGGAALALSGGGDGGNGNDTGTVSFSWE